MYILENMIDMGLKEGQKWPSKEHRIVASNLCLCNPNITTRDKLESIVQKVLTIPNDKIEKIHIEDLPSYGIEIGVIV